MFESPLIRTIQKTLKTPSNHTYNILCETFGQLKKTEKLLKGLNLYNEKYLLCRNGIYYFVLKVNNQVLKKSLKTNNITYAIILREKILWRISQMEDKFKIHNGSYQVFKTNGSITLLPENETEAKLLDEMENTINQKIKRLKKDFPEVISKDIETRSKITLKSSCEEYIDFKKDTGLSDKQVTKYKQALDFLIVYFGAKKAVKDITSKDANDFRSFLLKVPKNYSQKKEFKDKDIKVLIEKKSKLLDGFEKPAISTVEETIKKVKAMFFDFENKGYVIKNPFDTLTKISKNNNNNEIRWKEFREKDLRDIFQYCYDNNQEESFYFLKFALYTGLRRGEILNIKIRDIDIDKEIIDILGTKTNNAKRIMVIHKDIKDFIEFRLKHNENSNEYLFFNSKTLPNGNVLNEKYRDDRVGAYINEEIIGKIISEDLKENYNIHSIRKNFTQIIYLSNIFGDLEIKTLLGHSTKSDITDNHYIRGKRDYKILKEKIDKVDFSEYLSDKQFEIKGNIFPSISSNSVNLDFS